MAKEVKDIEVGDKIEYHAKSGKWKKGKVHGIQRAEDPETNRVTGILFLIDTGREAPEHKGREDRQPEQVAVLPENIRPV